MYTQPPPVKAVPRDAGNKDANTGLRTVSIGEYSYTITPDDLREGTAGI